MLEPPGQEGRFLTHWALAAPKKHSLKQVPTSQLPSGRMSTGSGSCVPGGQGAQTPASYPGFGNRVPLQVGTSSVRVSLLAFLQVGGWGVWEAGEPPAKTRTGWEALGERGSTEKDSLFCP